MMVVGNVVLALPATVVILSTGVIRRDPVRPLIRRLCPVAVVPLIVLSLRILVALDPLIAWTWAGRDAVRAFGRWWTDVDADAHLSIGR